MKTSFLLAALIGLASLAAPSVGLAQRPLERKDCIIRIETCEAILREFQADPSTAIPADVLKGARALVITNQFKGGLILGIKDGYGVLLAKKADGQWGLPILIRAGETSLGLQVGGHALETIYVFNDAQTPRRMFSQRLNIGADAAAVAGPRAAESGRSNEDILQAAVLVYSKARGLLAGATVKTGFLAADNDANRLLYSTTFTMPEILDSDWINPPEEVQPLLSYIRSIAP
ncbi:MAG: lipid-binding SYLF domain-containing protein [Verrucomicrobia bacterium]|nr:lipid-binding SYLF domain-containing protein [Verrucomicrobiota bacterium]